MRLLIVRTESYFSEYRFSLNSNLTENISLPREKHGRANAEIKKKGVPVWDEFLDVFKKISGLPPDRAV